MLRPTGADWYLSFGETRPITLEECQQVLSAFVGAPVTTEIGEFSGNPRDGYARTVTITAQRTGDEIRLEMRLTQMERGPDDPLASTSLGGVTIHAPAASFATKLAAWHALRDALVDIGCTDRTLVSCPSPIVDHAEAAGETTMAMRLRADITAALVAEAPRSRFSVSLMSPRADDLEAVLAAYVDPQAITSVSLEDCELRALPAGLARFPNIEQLSLVHNNIDVRELCRVSLPKLTSLSLNGIDGSALRGISLPTLTTLNVRGPALRKVSRDDLAGFPGLTVLVLCSSQLEELDPDIIEVCPKLRRVLIMDTPLARDEARIAVLRDRWQAVHWELKW